MTRLLDHYQKKVVPEFVGKFGLTNPVEAPKISKVVVSVGVTETQHQDAALASMTEQLKVITGQKPKVTRAKKSIASFNLREGDPIGLMVTLRGKRMYQFVDKLIHIVLPRVKDFQGVSRKAFDKNGNYNLGLSEQIVFPEVEYDKIDRVRGLQITIVTTTNDSSQAEVLLELMGMPFAKEVKEDKRDK